MSLPSKLESVRDTIYNLTDGVTTSKVASVSLVLLVGFVALLLWISKGVLTEHNVDIVAGLVALYLVIRGALRWYEMRLNAQLDLASLTAFQHAVTALNADGSLTADELSLARSILQQKAGDTNPAVKVL